MAKTQSEPADDAETPKTKTKKLSADEALAAYEAGELRWNDYLAAVKGA